MDTTALANLLFPEVTETPADLEQRYPPRNLPEGARVCRMAPSPTGFMHLGNLYGAIADERLAHQSGGVFYLRIEDTDQKREVAGGVETILDTFSQYKLPFDEGATLTGDSGAYGPYRQRQRASLYHVCARWLVLQGKAYPCFLTEEELTAMRETQAAEKLNFGCYGDFARYRDTPIDLIKSLIDSGKPYVVRYRSEGDLSKRIAVDDLIRGRLDMPENDQDVVLLKADGIPTYHFAHVVDDHLMRTTVVVRGEEWLATLPIHIQLFGAMGWKPPKYLHTASLMKMDGGSKRKLSKRKDPELALSFYSEKGYTVAAVKEYLMSLLNSNFEDWRAMNPEKPLEDFPFSPKKMGTSGALFSIEKLDDVSKGVVSRMSADEVYGELTAWADRYDPDFAALLRRDEAKTKRMLAIGRGGKKPRKDITAWSDAKTYLSFFFDETFTPDYTLPETVPAGAAKEMLAAYADLYNPADDSGEWFAKVKQLACNFGYCDDMKAYKQTPENWPGSVADVSNVVRLAIAGRPQSPDLCEVMQIMGPEMVRQRLDRMMGAL
ncbi:glutamate--tRNA ligase [Ruminococcaceae bacterium OttesenSCG-928-D13]|nr:glutamate--tRNA ligase [Ruminococcaceae bacterium OttesenSCG-928-D13]